MRKVQLNLAVSFLICLTVLWLGIQKTDAFGRRAMVEKLKLRCNSSTEYFTSYGFVCCNSTLLVNGIDQSSEAWLRCFNVTSNGEETASQATWRVYSCVLSKLKSSKMKSISLVDYAKLMSQNYPENIKKLINEFMDKLVSHSSDTSWLVSDVSLIDYTGIEKIRVRYSLIEMQGMDMIPKLKELYQTDFLKFDRFGQTCGNHIMPFSLLEQSPLNFVTQSIYQETAEKLVGNLTSNQLILNACNAACYFVEKSILKMEDIKVLEPPALPSAEVVVKAIIPYMPSVVQNNVQSILEEKTNGTQIRLDLESGRTKYNLTSSDMDSVYPCYTLYWMTYEVLHYTMELGCLPRQRDQRDPYSARRG